MDLALLDTDQLSEVIKLRNLVVRQRALGYTSEPSRNHLARANEEPAGNRARHPAKPFAKAIQWRAVYTGVLVEEHAMKNLMALVTAGMVVAAAGGADKPLSWPQFRGPGGAGVAHGQKPPVEFGPEKNVRWKVAVPSGLSSPIVASDNLVLTAFE